MSVTMHQVRKRAQNQTSEQTVRNSRLSSDGFEITRCFDQTPTRFKVFGERASGTNFVEFILENNTALNSVDKYEYGWKHGFPGMMALARSDIIIAVFREAFAWLESLYVKPWNVDPSVSEMEFSDFIRAEWLTTVQRPRRWHGLPWQAFHDVPLQCDRDPISGQTFRNVVQMRNRKTAAWLGLANRGANVVLVRYEAVNADPGRFLADVGQAFDVDIASTLRLPEQNLGAGEKFFPVSERKSQLKGVSEKDRSFVLGELDRQQEAHLGYTYPG